jgi:hypothetical protein
MAQIRGTKGGSDKRRLKKAEKKGAEEEEKKSQVKDEKVTPLLNNPKPYYHALRLLQEAKRMVSGEAPKVWLEVRRSRFSFSSSPFLFLLTL